MSWTKIFDQVPVQKGMIRVISTATGKTVDANSTMITDEESYHVQYKVLPPGTFPALWDAKELHALPAEM